MVGLLDLRGRDQSDVTSTERRGVCLVIYGLVASFKAEKRKVNEGDAWFRVLPPLSLSFSLFLSLSLSLSLTLSLSQLEFWSADCRLPSFDLSHCREICLLYNFSPLIRSDWVFPLFLPRRSRIGRKITSTYFYFLTNFIDISLCADPMRRNTFFFILKKVTAPITSGECSRGR